MNINAKRTRPLLTGAKLVAKRLAGQRAAENRQRCNGCGSWLNAQGQCRHPDCEGQKRVNPV